MIKPKQLIRETLEHSLDYFTRAYIEAALKLSDSSYTYNHGEPQKKAWEPGADWKPGYEDDEYDVDPNDNKPSGEKEYNGRPLDETYTIDDIDPDTLNEMIRDCQDFQKNTRNYMSRQDGIVLKQDMIFGLPEIVMERGFGTEIHPIFPTPHYFKKKEKKESYTKERNSSTLGEKKSALHHVRNKTKQKKQQRKKKKFTRDCCWGGGNMDGGRERFCSRRHLIMTSINFWMMQQNRSAAKLVFTSVLLARISTSIRETGTGGGR